MPDAHSDRTSIGPDDLRTMLRVAGLTIEDARIPAVLAEVNSQLAYARIIDSVLEDADESAFESYDPAWQIRIADQSEVSR